MIKLFVKLKNFTDEEIIYCFGLLIIIKKNNFCLKFWNYISHY